jgi:hypothetical protein
MHNFQDEISDSTSRELNFKDNKTEERPSTTDPLTRLYAPHYTPLYCCHSCKTKIHVATVLHATKWVNAVKQGTTAKTMAALYAAPCFQHYHIVLHY